MLYAKHGVADIRAARSDAENLNRTTNLILSIIDSAKRMHSHAVVFITGIPGAGKTLCGLNAAFAANSGATFLTGTLPMIHVLKKALEDDAKQNSKKSRDQAQRETKTKIQSVLGFLRHYRASEHELPEHVIVFDEAQRAWSAAYGASSKHKLPKSEAALTLDIMARHSDYAVIIALVGNGQEINSGEAGLAEWGYALTARKNWKVYAASAVLTTTEPRQRLFSDTNENIILNDGLHLGTSLRNVESSFSAKWVDAVLAGEVKLAKDISEQNVPFFLTRSLERMKLALRQLARGERRSGLVCSSGAKRLVADGLWPKFDHLNASNVANWFLKRWPEDIRASSALEIPATEFACQGLELDYVGVCWGGDLIWNNKWSVRNFKGFRWENVKKQDTTDYQINTYRVLLTRARYDTVIWVPEGDESDKTREPAHFDRTASYLLECGAKSLPDFEPAVTLDPMEKLL